MNVDLPRSAKWLPIVLPLFGGMVSRWQPLPVVAALAVGIALFLFFQIPWRDWHLFLVRPLVIPLPNPLQVSKELILLAELSRKDGILAMESFCIQCGFQPLNVARGYAVDGLDPEYLETVIQREKRTVLDKLDAVVGAAFHLLLIGTVFILFLSVRAGMHDGLEALMSLFPFLFGAGLVLVWLHGYSQVLRRNLADLYDLVIIGMVGILRGVNPIMLELLMAGRHFEWLAQGETSFDTHEGDVTPKAVAERLERYLAEDHPSNDWVDAVWPDGKPEDESDRFHGLMTMDSRSFQTLLREVDPGKLITALKRADPDMVRKVIDNISLRAGYLFLNDLKWARIPSEGDTAEAQQTIMKVARRLEAEGLIDTTDKHRTGQEDNLANFLDVSDDGYSNSIPDDR